MAKKIEQPAEQPLRTWFFPTLGKSVQATSSDEALKLVEDQEANDVDA